MSVLYLRPAVFSKRKTTFEIKSCLLTSPHQKPNSPEAFKGQVMEFTLNNGSYGEPVATLFELAQEFPETDTFIITCPDGKCLQVEKNKSMFVPKDSFNQKYTTL